MKSITISGDNHIEMSSIHELLIAELNFGQFYGRNFSALLDMLSTEIPRPFHIQITSAKLLKENLQNDYDTLLSILNKVEALDEQLKLENRFTFTIVN